MSFWLERFSILLKYIHSRAIFVLEKGGGGGRASIGTYTVHGIYKHH